MNYLAHVLLAGPEAMDRLGAMLGDFVKGPLPGLLPESIARGIALHRSIDSFADNHPAFRRSRARASPQRRRFAGIMADMFYDHFLARHWARFSDETLQAFSAGTYRLLDEHTHLLPAGLARALPFMKRDDWLSSYLYAENVGRALDRMAEYRLSRSNTLAGAIEELQARYAEFEQDFLDFFPDALRFAKDQRAIRGGGDT